MQTVYLVFCTMDYEGYDLHSVHTTEVGAKAECDRIAGADNHKHCDRHIIESKEVQP